MNSILKKFCIKKWKTSDTYKEINLYLSKNAILINENIINSYFGDRKNNEFYISKYLFTNKDLVDILNYLQIRSAKEEFYEIINEYNSSLPIKWDEVKGIYYIKEGYEKHPVTGISWNGAKFIAELFDGRLPTEDEWTVAAKSGKKEYLYSWGKLEPTNELANYEENVGQTSIIGSYPPNELGLYDMSGNVEEWCENSYMLPNGKESKYEKVIKGGCWYKSKDNLLCDSKRTRFLKMGATGIGFRIVWDK